MSTLSQLLHTLTRSSMLVFTGLLPAVLLLLLAGGCGTSDAPETSTEQITDHTIEDLTRFAGEPDTLIGTISAMAVAENGELFVRDRNTLHAFRTDGTHRASFGGTGEGPGEIQFPMGMNVRNDSVFVVDLAKQGQVTFTTDGAYAGLAPVPVFGSRYAFGPAGHIAILGATSPDSTVAVYDDAGTELYQAVTPLQEGRIVIDMQDTRSRIVAGEVPDVLHAMSGSVALDADGGLWFVRSSTAEVMRYTSSGQQEWARTLDIPETDRIYDAFVEANAALDEPNRLFPLQYVHSPVAVGEALWLMVGMPEDEPAQLIVLDSEGALRHRLHVPGAEGARSFVLSPDRTQIYLSIPNRVQIMAAALPAAVR
ncbi:MAG: hypothetical protein PPP56_00100 [Longimonas sp.]|uniref:hypothetical protein n=1 Tax=Longimonas sp. TaxID=2039626 RepID=UPI0033520C20